MIPPVFTLAEASAPVTALLGSNPLRLYPFGEGPAKGAPGYTTPYAVWQSITINPENYLGTLPNSDSYSTQVDVYGTTMTSVRNAATALRNAYEPAGYVMAMREWPRETDTNLYRYSMDVDFIKPRP